MMLLLTRLLVLVFSFSILLTNVSPVLALDIIEKTEVTVQKADSLDISSQKTVPVEKEEITKKKTERTTINSSYNFIFYLVTIIVKAMSYYPQR